jgi:hypothetical protein
MNHRPKARASSEVDERFMTLYEDVEVKPPAPIKAPSCCNSVDIFATSLGAFETRDPFRENRHVFPPIVVPSRAN